MERNPKTRPGSRKITIVDVADAAGVSPGTVSNALNGRGNVDPATMKKVRAAVDRLGYVRNQAARRLRTGRANAIGIVSSMSFAVSGGRARQGFVMEIAAAAAARAMDRGLALVLVPPLARSRSPFETIQIDGALVVEPAADDPELAILAARGVPVVTIGQAPGPSPLPFVDLQPYRVARLLLDHLVRQSSGQVGLIAAAQPRHTHTETRRAYLDFVRERGMSPMMQLADEAMGEQAGYSAALALLTECPAVDAVFVAVDAFAAGAQRAAAALGRVLPNDLTMATRYDGLHARACDPPLTSVNLHLDDLGTLGVELLLEHMGGDTARTSVAGPLATLMPRRSSARTG